MKKIYLLAMITVALFFAACDDQEKENTEEQADLPQIEITVTDTAAYTGTGLAEAIADAPLMTMIESNSTRLANEIKSDVESAARRRSLRMDTIFLKHKGFSLTRQWKVESIRFTYGSLAADGSRIELSARVTFPNAIDHSGLELTSMTLAAHDLYQAGVEPTKSLSPLAVRALFNSAVVEPDFQGYGNTATTGHPGVAYAALARQMSDCAVAAQQIMADHGVTMAEGATTTVWGYGTGGAVALALGRYYDQTMPDNVKKLLNISQIYAGGAPVQLDRMVQYMDEHPTYSADALCYTLRFASALPSSTFYGLEMKDFFPEWMQYAIVEAGGEQQTYYAAATAGYAVEDQWPMLYPARSLKNHFAADMTKSDGHLDYENEKVGQLMSLLHHLSDQGGWMPTTDIYMTHAMLDELVPAEQAHEFYETKTASGHMNWKQTTIGLVGLTMSNHFAASYRALGDFVRYETPAEVFRRQ